MFTVGMQLCFNRLGNAMAFSEPFPPMQASHRISMAAPQLLEAAIAEDHPL